MEHSAGIKPATWPYKGHVLSLDYECETLSIIWTLSIWPFASARDHTLLLSGSMISSNQNRFETWLFPKPNLTEFQYHNQESLRLFWL